MPTIARCGIYDQRPELCRQYPNIAEYIPRECTYTFPDGRTREGECACGVGACCSVPRRDGEPTGQQLSEEDGGQPCKHLIMIEEPEKIAASDGLQISGAEVGRQALLRVFGQ